MLRIDIDTIPLMAACVVAMVSMVVAQEREKLVPSTSPTTQAQAPDRHGRMIDVPRAISASEWDSYCALLALSESQRASLAGEFESYLAEYQQIQDSLVPKARELGYADVEAQGRGMDVEMATREAFHSALQAIREQLLSADQKLLTAIRGTLAEVQLPALDRVQSQRLRHCRMRQYNHIGRSAIDLGDLLQGVFQDRPMPPEAEAILEEYDATITPMIVRLDVERVRLTPSVARQESMMRTASSAEERAKAGEERQLYLSKLARRESRLADHNEHFLDRLRSVLPPDAAALCQDRFDRIAYAPLLPDPSRPDALVEHIRSQPQLQKDVLDAVDDLLANYRAAIRAVMLEVRELHREWTVDFASTLSSRGYREYREAVSPLLGRMCDLNEQVVNQVLAVLPPGVSAGLSKEERGWRAALTERRAQIAAPNFPPP